MPRGGVVAARCVHCAKAGVARAFHAVPCAPRAGRPAAMTQRLRLTLFGVPQWVHAGTPSALAFERRTQLLLWLALQRGWAARTDAAALLWPDIDARLAHANLRKTLFRLQALPWGAAIGSAGGALRLDADTDVADFESALREQRLDDALALYRGELLVGHDDPANEAWTSWLHFERDRLRAAWRGAALAWLRTEVDAAAAVALSARLLDADPLDEAALQAHMRWLAHDGQAGAARQAYRHFTQRVASELGVSPAAELQALHDAIAAPGGLVGLVGPAATGGAEPGFVGRAAERRRIAELLARGDCRLLGLVGPGGVGKTALARQAADDVAARFADGTLFVSLEDLATTPDLDHRLARELGCRASADPFAEAVEALRERQRLLVLDGFEHLADAVPRLSQLLHECPRVKLLVTSRVRLGVAGEWTLPLAGLPCPDPEDADRIEAFDAVRLFTAAAQRVDPAFEPAAHAPALIGICRQVEGLPLALELAAAWVRVLPCADIADELQQRGDLLRAVDPARPARHASFDAVFEQSWQRLGASERDALARLTVLRGGFGADAARAVAAAPLPVLAALADKSLLIKDGERMHLHALVQQRAAERFADADARHAAEAAHASHFLGLLAQLRHRVDDGDRNALRQVELEFENCRRAWGWAVAHGDADALAASAATLMHYCDHRLRLADGLELMRQAAGADVAAATPRLRVLVLAMAAHLEYRLDRYADAEASAMAALAAARASADHDARLQCLKVLGACSLRRGRHADARRYFQRALRLAPTGTDPRNAAGMLDNLARVELATGRYDEARRLSLAALTEFRRLRDVAGEALCLNNLGAWHLDRGDHAAAGVHLRDALALSDRHGLAATRGYALTNLTELAVKTGDADAAHRHGTRALEVAAASGNRVLESAVRLQLARLAVHGAALDEARAQLAAATTLALAVDRPTLLWSGVTCFALLLHAQGHAAAACSLLRHAVAQPGMNAVERDEAAAWLGAWAAAGATARPWPGLSLDDLAHRIVAEAALAHAPLIALLGGTPPR